MTANIALNDVEIYTTILYIIVYRLNRYNNTNTLATSTRVSQLHYYDVMHDDTSTYGIYYYSVTML